MIVFYFHKNGNIRLSSTSKQGKQGEVQVQVQGVHQPLPHLEQGGVVLHLQWREEDGTLFTMPHMADSHSL